MAADLVDDVQSAEELIGVLTAVLQSIATGDCRHADLALEAVAANGWCRPSCANHDHKDPADIDAYECGCPAHEDLDQFFWQGKPMSGLCGHCQRNVDSTDPNHRVTSIVQGGRGVECVLRGDIDASQGGPVRLRAMT